MKQEQYCSWALRKQSAAADRLTTSLGDDATKALVDSLKKIFVKGENRGC
jgi:hypothetical protein